jgi:DNA-binding CsgD family transcriptional regulator
MPRTYERITPRIIRKPSDREMLASLTQRERCVCALMAGSYSTRQIAETMGITVGSAKVYRNALYKKLNRIGIVDVAGVTRFACRMKLSRIV